MKQCTANYTIQESIWARECKISSFSLVSHDMGKANKNVPERNYSRFRLGKHLSSMFPIENVLKRGDALLPFLFNFALEYAIRRVQVMQDGLKLNGRHQLPVYADDIIIMGGNVHT